MRFVLIGNFGVGNLGDEAIKQYMLTRFPEHEWRVISAHPRGNELCRLPCGIRSFFRPWRKTIYAIKQSDGVVFAGGSLFTDAESRFACVLWWWHGAVASWMGKKLFLAFQGIGPFRSRFAASLARRTAKRSTFLSVRDEDSCQRVQLWSLNKEIIRTFDPVLSFIKNKKSNYSAKKILIVIPRNNSDAIFRHACAEALQHVAYDEVRILSLQPGDASERKTCDDLCALCTASVSRCSVLQVHDLATLIEEMQQASFALSQRYHGALAALALGVPFKTISQSPGDKLDSLMHYAQSGTLDHLHDLVRQGEEALRVALGASKE